MKKMIIILVVVMLAISVIPITSYAEGHDKAWKHHHKQVWKAHEREWSKYDRQWAAHRGDRHWREEHIKMWPEWYRWHKENESVLSIRIPLKSHGGPSLDIDFRN